jgi:outer membrane protein assembly factor BamB
VASYWNVVYWNGRAITNNNSLSYTFTPTNSGMGTNIFYLIYTNPPPCAERVTNSITNMFAVAQCLASLGGLGDNFGPGVDASPALSLDGSTVYIASTGTLLYALNASNGAVKCSNGLATWGGTITPSAAISSNGTVYSGSEFGSPTNGYLYSFTSNLNYNWSNYLGISNEGLASVFGTPTVTAGGAIYVGTAWDYQQLSPGNGLFSFNSNSSENWFFQPQETGMGSGGDVNSSATVGTDGTVYFLAENWRLYALYPTTGNVKWFLPIPGQTYPDSSPAIAPDGSIVVGSGSPYLYSVNPDGSLKWFCHVPNPNWSGAAEFNSNVIFSSPVVDPSGTVYVGTGAHIGANDYVSFLQSDFQGAVYAITNGQVKWAFTNVPGWIVGSCALAADGTVYACATSTNHTYGMLYAITNGVQKWAFKTGGDIISSPVIGNDGGVIFGCEDGNVYKVAGGSLPATAGWPMYRHDPQHTGSLAGTNNPAPGCEAPFPNDGYFTNGVFSGFTFYTLGPPGSPWSVYHSTSLSNWTDTGDTVTHDANGVGVFTNCNLSAGLSNMYYFLTNNLTNDGCRSRVIGFLVPYAVEPGKQYMIADPFYQVDDTNLSHTTLYFPPMNTVGALFCGYAGNIMAPDFDTYPFTTISVPGIATNAAVGGCIGAWGPNGDILLLPGRGAFLNTPTNFQDTSVWFTGLVAEAVTNQILPGTNYLGSALPIAGGISSVLGYTNATTNDQLIQWDVANQVFVTNTSLGGTNWYTNEPYIHLAEGFILVSRYSNTWIQRLSLGTGD